MISTEGEMYAHAEAASRRRRRRFPFASTVDFLDAVVGAVGRAMVIGAGNPGI
jgi:hypothetical protein